MLVAERFVERVRVGSAVGGVEHHRRAAPGSGFFLQRVHQQLADAGAAKGFADDQAGYLAAGLVSLDEVLYVQNTEARDLTFELGHDEPGRRIRSDALDPLGRLRRRRGIAKLAEELGDTDRIPGLGFAKLYGGGGGGPPGGGPSSSTYVVLLRPHPPP